ncbi:hypothetical protein CRG98_050226 [Punica granatum]|uniref:Uncharacterized protein n=1 Tax=Punica granatum TaxID=22663 RepID=A0A2I0GKU3_PUNGR|nr:hypothetical protein CRG98_050226 [Punica granatum]
MAGVPQVHHTNISVFAFPVVGGSSSDDCLLRGFALSFSDWMVNPSQFNPKANLLASLYHRVKRRHVSQEMRVICALEGSMKVLDLFRFVNWRMTFLKSLNHKLLIAPVRHHVVPIALQMWLWVRGPVILVEVENLDLWRQPHVWKEIQVQVTRVITRVTFLERIHHLFHSFHPTLLSELLQEALGLFP